MPYRQGQPGPFENFEKRLEDIFSKAGMRYSSQQMGSEQDPFLRFSFQPAGTQIEPLILDLSPGPKNTGFGSIAIRSEASDWHAYMGSEIDVQPQRAPRLYDPYENLARYVIGAQGTASESGPFGETQQQAFGRAIGMGIPEYGLAGSVPRAGGPETQGAISDVSSWLTVNVNPEIQDMSKVVSSIYGQIHTPVGSPQDVARWGTLKGYAPVQEQESVMGTKIQRWKPMAQMLGQTGNLLGIGTDPADIIKRRSIAHGGFGTRENVNLFGVDPSGTGLVQQQPQLIGGMGAGQEGYRLMNLIYPDETQRQSAMVRPGTMVTASSAFPGAVTSYGDPLGGKTFMFGYQSQIKEQLPSEDITNFANARFEFGVFEGGERVRGLKGFYLEPGKSATIGRYTMPAGLGEDPITKEIRFTAEGKGYRFGGDPTLNLPPAVYTDVERRGLGHPGVDPRGLLSSNVSLLANQPAIRSRIESGFGGQVNYGTQGGAFLNFPVDIQVGAGMKGGGWKAGVMRPGGTEFIPREALQAEVGGATLQVQHATSEMKSSLAAFTGFFGTLPTGMQQKLVQQTFQGPVGQAMSGYIGAELERTTALDVAGQGTAGYQPQAGALSLQGLARSYFGASGSQEPYSRDMPYRMMESMRTGFQGLSAESQAQYGAGPVGDVWNTPVIQTKAEMEYYKEQAGGDPRVRFSPIGLDKYMMQTRSEARMTTAATPVAPEFAYKQARFGLSESTALQSAFPTLATFLGLGEGQSPYATGSRPPHMQAWDVVSDVYRYNKDAGRFRSETGENIGSPLRMESAVELTDERRRELQSAIAGGATMEEMGGITGAWGQGPLYNPRLAHGQQYMEQAGTIMQTAAFEQTLQGELPISRMGRTYMSALQSFTQGGGGLGSAELGKFQQARKFAMETGAGTAVKNLPAGILPSGIGGRYLGRTGMDPGMAIVNEQNLNTMFQQMARAGGGGLSGVGQARMFAQTEASMRRGEFGGAFQRHPILSEMTGTVGQGVVTPGIAGELTGISQVSASRVGIGSQAGQLIAGDPSQFSALRAGPSLYNQLVGDLDVDPILGALGMKLDPGARDKLLMQRVARGGGEGNLDVMFGSQAGEFNELQGALGKLGEKLGTAPGISEVSGADLITAAQADFAAGAGMGVTYNQRRLFTSAASVAGQTKEEIARGSAGGALGYQRYLDKTIDASGGFRNLESFVQRLYMGEKGQRPFFGTVSGSGENWTRLMEQTDSERVQTASLNRDLGGGLGTAIGLDISEGHMTPAYGAMLMAQKGIISPGDLETKLSRAGQDKAQISSVFADVRKMPGYDVTRTAGGIGVISETVRRLQTRTAKDPSGAEYNVLERIGQRGFTFQGQQRQYGELSQVGEISATMAMTAFQIGKTGPLTPSQVADIGEYGGEGRVAGRILSTFGQGDIRAAEAAAQENVGVQGLPASVTGQPGLAPHPSDIQFQVFGKQELPSGETVPIGSYSAGGGFVPPPQRPGGFPRPMGAGGGGMPPGGSLPPDDPTGPFGSDEQRFRLFVQNIGADKLPGARRHTYMQGAIAAQEMITGGVGLGVMGRLRESILETKGIGGREFDATFGGTEGSVEFQRAIHEMARRDPERMSQILQDYSTEIKQLEQYGKKFIAAQKEFRTGEVTDYAAQVEGLSGITSTMIQQGAEGELTGIGMRIRAGQTLTAVGKQYGLTGAGADVYPTGAETTSMTDALEKLTKSTNQFRTTIDASKESIKDQTISRKESIQVGKDLREMELDKINVARTALAPHIRTAEAAVSRAQESGVGIPEAQTRLQGMYEQQARLGVSEAGLLTRGQPKGWQQAIKSLTGGWNLMYMGRMLGLGMGQFEQGAAESEQYDQASAILQRRMMGGDEVYTSPQQTYQRALIRSGGGAMRGFMEARAATTGAGGMSDILGAGLTGLGVMSVAGFAGGTLAGMGGAIGAFGTFMAGPAAIPLGLGAAAIGIGGAQYGYYQNREEEAMRVAAAAAGGNQLEAASGLLTKLMPQSLVAQYLGGVPREETALGMFDYDRVLREQLRTPEGTGEGRGVAGITKSGTGMAGLLRGAQQGAPGLANVSPEDQAIVAKMLGMEPGFARGIPSTLVEELGMVGIRRGLDETQLEEMITGIGGARMAGLPTQELAQMMAALGGGGVGPMGLQELEERYMYMGEEEIMPMQTGMGVMMRTPGILHQTAGMTPEERERLALQMKPVGGSEWETDYMQRREIFEQQRAVGIQGRMPSISDFISGVQKSPQQLAQDQAANMLATRGVGLQQQMLGYGITDMGGMIGGMDVGQMNIAAGAMSMNRNVLTQLSQQGGLDPRYALGDIGLGGQQTGFAWGTTGLAQGSMTGAQVAEGIAGPGWEESGAWQGAVSGVLDPTGQMVGGQRGLAWAQTYLQRGYASDQMAMQKESLAGRAGYMQRMWGIQDQQRALAHEQRTYGFELQEQQFEIGGRQWEETRGLARTGQLRQRQWAMQDRAYEDTTSALQWQWQTEDFEENVRFMSGRQRQQAERGMERKTIMRGLGETQRDRERGRQEEMWALQDEQFTMQREHYEENRELIEENMEKQREFYGEGKKLQDEMIEAQRAYQMAQLGLQERQIELQEKYTTDMNELQDVSRLISEHSKDITADFNNWIALNLPEALDEITAALRRMIGDENRASRGSRPSTGRPPGRQMGGDMIPGVSYVTGEIEAEMVRPGVIGSIVTQNDFRQAARMNNDRWNDSSSFVGGSSSSGGQQILNLYIGNKKIKQFIVDTISEELEVH
jgi:hypothetical protein